RAADAMPCGQILELATIRAAQCLGLEAQVGSLEIGKRADLIIVDLHAPHMLPRLPNPRSNVIEQLVYAASASDVLTTIVDGRILMQDRRVLTLDEAEIEPQVQDAALDLMHRAGLM